MAAEKLARFPLPSGASQGGGQGQARGIFILFWSDGRSVGRSAALSPLEIISVRHTHFPTLAMWPGKIPPMTDAANEATRLACARPTIPSSFARQCLSVHRDLLQTAGGRRRRARASIAALPQWDFWLARVALLQFLASNPPPSPADRQTDIQPVWHLAVTLGATTATDRVALRRRRRRRRAPMCR